MRTVAVHDGDVMVTHAGGHVGAALRGLEVLNCLKIGTCFRGGILGRVLLVEAFGIVGLAGGEACQPWTSTGLGVYE